MAKLNIKKGDSVIIIAGESKGKTGTVKKVYTDSRKVIVDGDDVKKVSRHTKPNAANPQGGIIKQDFPIDVSNVMLVDPKTGEPTRVGRKQGENGKSVRYAKKSEEVIK